MLNAETSYSTEEISGKDDEPQAHADAEAALALTHHASPSFSHVFSPQHAADTDRSGQAIVPGLSLRTNLSNERLLPSADEEEAEKENDRNTLSRDQITASFFCSNPVRNYARVIMCKSGSKSSLDNLLNIANLRQICSIDRSIRRLPHFQLLADKQANRKLCPSWTLANYVAALTNRKSCRFITESDAKVFENSTRLCWPYYLSGELHKNCWDGHSSLCGNLPPICVMDNLFWNLFYFVYDGQSESLESGKGELKCSLGLLPVWSGPLTLPLYETLHQVNLSQSGWEVTGIEMGIRDELFDIRLVEDARFMAMSMTVIVIVLWMYSASLFVTMMNILATFFPLVLAYFICTFLLRITFFPFMNLLACVIMIVIGADALVIYVKLWHLAKSDKDDGKFEKIVYETVRHSFQAILVSSLTASAALFADLASPIVAIRCFSVFAGLSVVLHYIFVLTWLPVTVIIADKWGSALSACRYLCIQRIFHSKMPSCPYLWRPLRHFLEGCRIFFEKLLPCIVIRLRWIWIVVFLAITTAAFVLVFHYPRLQLPSSGWFRMWNRKHPFEQYQRLKHRFNFENETSEVKMRMPLRFVWGVLPERRSSRFNPASSSGNLEFDDTFDLSAQESQTWMAEFCLDLKKQPFYKEPAGLQITNCFVLSLKSWLESQECTSSSSCCQNLTFPLLPATFHKCAQEFSKILQGNAAHAVSGTKYAGPFYEYDQIQAKFRLTAVIIEYTSSYHFSYTYSDIYSFYSSVENWFQSRINLAPATLRNGFFTSNLDFFDLQGSLLDGTVSSLIIAFIVALIVLFMTTLNVCISLYAIVTVAAVVVVTMGVLVLLGWELNVFEATVIALGVGLSVDFTLHYSVAYYQSEAEDRHMRTNCTIAEMANPVCASALTTFLAGALMYPSELLIYQQIGLFIMLIISISLLFSTIFFPALLAIIGPEEDFLQFYYPSCICQPICCRTHPAKLVEKSLHASIEFDTTISTSALATSKDRENHLKSPNNIVPVLQVSEPEAEPEQKPIVEMTSEEAGEETDSVGELGSVPTSRGPSRGPSLVRKSSGKGLHCWDYVLQKLPLNRHFSVAGSSVLYIDAESVTSSDIPAVIPNLRPDIPEVWIRRTEPD